MSAIDQAGDLFAEFGALAGKLASIADLLPGPDNRHRRALRGVSAAMSSANPSIASATSHTMAALFDLAADGNVEDKPETWLLAACMTLLAHEKMRLAGGVASLPREFMLRKGLHAS